MDRLNVLAAIGFATAALTAAPSFAGDNNGNAKAPYSSFSESRAGFETKADVAVYWGDGALLRSKNTQQVTHPAAGIFCVFPSVAVNENHNYPQVSVDWGRSNGNNLIAYVDIDGGDCSGTPYEIQTYTFSGKTVTLSDSVAFVFTIG